MPRVLDQFPSSSSDRVYYVIANDQNEVSCNCPAWTRQTHYRNCPQTRGDKCTCRQLAPHLPTLPKDVRTCPHLRTVWQQIDSLGGLQRAIDAMRAIPVLRLRDVFSNNRPTIGVVNNLSGELDTLQRALRNVDQRASQRREDRAGQRREQRALSASVRGRIRRQERANAVLHAEGCRCLDCAARRLDASRAAAPATRPIPPRRAPGLPTRGIRIREDDDV